MFNFIVSSAGGSHHPFLSLVPALSVAVGAIAVIIAFFNVNRQLKHARRQFASSYWENREEALRSKRATAKALLQEIQSMASYVERGIWAEPTVYQKLVGEVGRLSTECIGSVIRFHTELSIWAKHRISGQTADAATVARLGHEAIDSLSNFLKVTRPELDEARERLRSYKL